MLRHLFITLCLFLFTSQAQAQNYSKQCTDVDANSVKQVQTCIASSSQMSQGLDQAGKDFAGCSRLKMSFTMLTGVRQDADSDMMPSCHVFAKVLENLNGRKPVWTGCIEFAEKQTNLSGCYAALKRAQLITNTFHAKTCPNVKNVLRGVAFGMSANYSLDFKRMPGCETIAQAMRENNHEMSGYACGKYKPDNQQHINACLHSYFAGYKYYGMPLAHSCDQLRQFYNTGVQSMYDGEKTMNAYGVKSEPPGFQIAQCGMLEEAVASYNEEEYNYEKFDNSDVEEAPARKTSRQTVSYDDEEPGRQTSRRERVRETVEEEEEPADAKSLLKQVALDRAGESKTVNRSLEKAAEYEEQYDELTAEEEEAEEEEEVTAESIKQEAKQKMKKKLFDKLGL